MLLKHTTIVHKAKIIKFYADHNPDSDREYNDWIQSLPGVISLTNRKIDDLTMERVIEFDSNESYDNWIAKRKEQQSWKDRSEYESKYGILSRSTKELILNTENGTVAVRR